jgi:ribulose-bisphosphate carboxylase large chain
MMKIPADLKLNLSGIRFSVDYSLHGMEEAEAHEIARLTCVEQTVEFPEGLIPEGEIKNQIIGRIEKLTKSFEKIYLVTISYAIETTSFEILQLLNVVYGNICMAKGVRVEDIRLPDELLSAFRGPRFGMDGLRERLQVFNRPLLCAPIKPMGLRPKDFGQMAYELAVGGIDIIKDDHGLANQPFCSFNERVDQVIKGINKGNKESGNNCVYFPNINTRFDLFLERAAYVKNAGAGGFMILPGLVGWDAMRVLADDDNLALPIFCHPALLGGYIKSSDTGFSTRVISGIIPRLAGADIAAFQNFIGRLTNSREDCLSTRDVVLQPMGKLKPSIPSTGGGMTLHNLPEFQDIYKNDVVYIMGGGLHHGDSLIENCRTFRKLIEPGT